MLSDLPPGTEDYSGQDSVLQSKKNVQNSQGKKIADIEKFMQNRQIKFNDGTSGPMFGFVAGIDQPAFLCYPCGATCYSELSLQDHLNGRKHSNKILSRSVWPTTIINDHPYHILNKSTLEKKSISSGGDNKDDKPPETTPAEVHQSKMMHYLDTLKTPLIGLEYFVEVVGDHSDFDNLTCTLCDKKGVLNVITNHITSIKHKLKYFSLHFPTAYRMLDKYRGNSKSYSVCLVVINNVCDRIEKDYGRRQPLTVLSEDFSSNRAKYIKMAMESKHISERDGKTYADMFDDAYIMAMTKGNGPSTSEPTQPKLESKEERPGNSITNPYKYVKDTNSIKITLKTTSLEQQQPQTEEVKDLREDLNERRAKKDLRDEIERISSRKYRDRVSPGSMRHSSPRRGRSPFRSRSPVRCRSPPYSRIPGRERSPPRGYPSYRHPSPSYGRRSHSRSPGYKPSRDRQHYRKRTRSPEWRKRISPRRVESPLKIRDRFPFSPERHSDVVKSVPPKEDSLSRRSMSPESEENKKQSLIIIDDFYAMPFAEFQNVDLRFLNQIAKKNFYKANIFHEKYVYLRNTLKSALDFHEKNPERHPLYEEEWKKFWNKRYKELKNEKIDINTYNLKPEWIIYWSKKIKEMNEEEFEVKKCELCRRLSLPVDDTELRKFFQETIDQVVAHTLKHKSYPPIVEKILREREKKLAKMELERRKDPSPLVDYPKESDKRRYQNPHADYPEESEKRKYQNPLVDYPMERSVSRTSSHHERKRSPYPPRSYFEEKNKRKQPSPVSDDSMSIYSDGEASNHSRGGVFRKGRILVSRERDSRAARQPTERAGDFTEVIKSADDINVISVLRLLTALENYLGSLGTKVVDLLALALKMEKEKPNSSEKILTDDEHCVLFETVKEKLKGQLLAGLVESNAVMATKKAIQYSASLIHMASKLAEEEKKNKEQSKEVEKSVPVTVEGIGAVEKAAIAHQIASALIAQGRTNVTTEELESLVNAVVGMVHSEEPKDAPNKSFTASKKKEEAGAGTSTANALQMLQSAYASQSAAARQKVIVEEEAPVSVMEGLSDSDLQTLLQNFEDLSSDEQNGLITYLKNLEKKDPTRVENLRKFVTSNSSFDVLSREKSPLSLREKSETKPEKPVPIPVTKDVSKVRDSDDDDDYTFDDVLKSASAKVNESQLQGALEVVKKSISESKPKDSTSLDISGIMSTLLGAQKTTMSSSNITSSSTTTTVTKPTQVDTSYENISKVLGLVATLSSQSNSAPSLTVSNIPSAPSQLVSAQSVALSNDFSMGMQGSNTSQMNIPPQANMQMSRNMNQFPDNYYDRPDISNRQMQNSGQLMNHMRNDNYMANMIQDNKPYSVWGRSQMHSGGDGLDDDQQISRGMPRVRGRLPMNPDHGTGRDIMMHPNNRLNNYNNMMSNMHYDDMNMNDDFEPMSRNFEEGNQMDYDNMTDNYGDNMGNSYGDNMDDNYGDNMGDNYGEDMDYNNDDFNPNVPAGGFDDHGDDFMQSQGYHGQGNRGNNIRMGNNRQAGGSRGRGRARGGGGGFPRRGNFNRF